MRKHLALVLAWLAISFALPTFAQEKEEVKPFPFTPIPAGPQLVQQIEAINSQFDEAINKHDAGAVAALFIVNATLVVPAGIFSGRDNIAKHYTDVFHRFNPSD
jgi:hypothetical protein